MSITSRFVNDEHIHAAVEDCPLDSAATSDDESVCASCRYNVISPGSERIGCIIHTPKAIYDSALARLAQRDADLRAQLRDLLRTHGGRAQSAAQAHIWLRLAEQWFKAVSATADAEPCELELAGVIARFAHAGMTLGEPIQLLG
jgi:hypothetical protein